MQPVRRCVGVYGAVAFPRSFPWNRFPSELLGSPTHPTCLHMSGVTPASQELVQPPIRISRPASDAGSDSFGSRAQRMDPALNGFQPTPIARLNNCSHRPRRTRPRVLEGVPLRRPINYSRATKVWLIGTSVAQIVSGLQVPIGPWFASTVGMGLLDSPGAEWN